MWWVPCRYAHQTCERDTFLCKTSTSIIFWFITMTSETFTSKQRGNQSTWHRHVKVVLNVLWTAVPACFQHSWNQANSPHNLLVIETVGCSSPIPTCLSIKPLKPLTFPWLHLSRQWLLSQRDAHTFTSSLPAFTFIPPSNTRALPSTQMD